MGKTSRLALHWQIIIGLVLGIFVGLILNWTWTPYTWGHLGVGDHTNYLRGQPGELGDRPPDRSRDAVDWLRAELDDLGVGDGAQPLKPPSNAYTGRVVAWLLDPIISMEVEADEADPEEADPQEDPGADPSQEPSTAPASDPQMRAEARAWLLERIGTVLETIEERSNYAIRPVQPPEDEALAAEVRRVVLPLAVEDPNADAGFAAAIPKLVANLNNMVGELFKRSLLFIAVPIVLFSLIAGVASLNDTAKLGRIGGKTIGIYICTTALAITIGLTLANLIGPGKVTSERHQAYFDSMIEGAEARVEDPPNVWAFLQSIVPTNPFHAMANAEMLQVVFIGLIIGIGLTLIPGRKSAPVVAFFQTLTDVIIKLVMLLMLTAPYAVFALIVPVVASLGLEILSLLFVYALCVLLGLAIMMFGVYPGLLRIITPVRYGRFFGAIAPAQLLAFSSSSSAATLPVTMECCERRLGVKEEVVSFVLPVGATINMDGTALYQGVAAVFIAQLFALDLTIAQQLTIVLTATLASIGTAGVPGAGMVMLVIVLQSANIPVEGIAIILGVDRLLDMCRTACNVTGDAAVCGVVAHTEGALLTEEEVERLYGDIDDPESIDEGDPPGDEAPDAPIVPEKKG